MTAGHVQTMARPNATSGMWSATTSMGGMATLPDEDHLRVETCSRANIIKFTTHSTLFLCLFTIACSTEVDFGSPMPAGCFSYIFTSCAQGLDQSGRIFAFSLGLTSPAISGLGQLGGVFTPAQSEEGGWETLKFSNKLPHLRLTFLSRLPLGK